MSFAQSAQTIGIAAGNSQRRAAAKSAAAADQAILDAIHELTQAVRQADERQYERDRMLYDLLAAQVGLRRGQGPESQAAERG